MPTNRTPIERPIQARITPELVEMYRRCLEIIEDGDDDVWEADGGRQREFHDVSLALHVGLGQKPWDYSVFSVSLNGPPRSWEYRDRHERAQQLRRALHEAALEQQA